MSRVLLTIGLSFWLLSLAAGEAPTAASWPQFRGKNAGGVSDERPLPAALDPRKNLLWKTAIPSGNSSPCVWGEQVFLTAFTDRKRLAVLCVGTGDGRIRWQREVPAERIENVHPRVGSPASPTPATDGQRVYVFFGSVGVVSFDFQGQQVWRHELGPFTYHLGWGCASSPILYGDAVILNCDHDGESFLIALDKATGREKWRAPRPEAGPSYSTPILWEVDGRAQLIVAGTGRTTAYDPHTGEEIWHVRQPESFVATTPVAAPGLLLMAAVDHRSATGEFRGAAVARRVPNFDAMFANHDGNRDGRLSPLEVPQMSPATFARIDADHDGFLTREELEAEFGRQQQIARPAERPQAERPGGPSGNALSAIRSGGRGDVTETHMAWRVAGGAPYVASPLFYGGYLYVVTGGGIVSCLDAATGKRAWRERLAAPGEHYASPVAGDGKVYLVSERGELTVLAAGPTPRVVSRQALGERCLATPAIAGGRLYLRTHQALYCMGNGSGE